jgi:hypothetical protein
VCYNKYCQEGSKAEAKDRKAHKSRIRPCRQSPLCRTESCCAGYKCEPAPPTGRKGGDGRTPRNFFKKGVDNHTDL